MPGFIFIPAVFASLLPFSLSQLSQKVLTFLHHGPLHPAFPQVTDWFHHMMIQRLRRVLFLVPGLAKTIDCE